MNTPSVSTLMLVCLLLPAVTHAQAADAAAPTTNSNAELAAAAAAEYARLQRPAAKPADSDADSKEPATPAAEGNRSQRSLKRLHASLLATERLRVRDSYRKQRMALVASKATIEPVAAESKGTSGGK